MYLDILNDDMVGFSNITAREMLEHLCLTYGNITAVDLENNFEQLCKAWDLQQPVETLVKKIKDCADFSEAGGLLIDHPKHINVGYSKIFTTGNSMSACHRWDEKDTADKTWENFKVHFVATHRQLKKMQGGSSASSGYYSANAAVGKTEDQMAEATIGTLANLVTAISTDRGVVATFTEANSRLAKKLEDRSNELKDIKALLKKERADRKEGPEHFQPLSRQLLLDSWRQGGQYSHNPELQFSQAW
jgi:hypothetical protein